MTKYVENEREENSAEIYDGIPSQERLESMSEISLAKLQESFSSEKAGLVVVQKEWRRREKLVQHELNRELVKAQNKTAVIASIFGIIGTIVGAILTAILTKILQ